MHALLMAKYRAVLKEQIVRRLRLSQNMTTEYKTSQSMSMKTRMIWKISPMSRSMSHADESESDDQAKVHQCPHCPYSTKYIVLGFAKSHPYSHWRETLLI